MGVSSTGWVLAFIKEEDMKKNSCYFVWKHYYCLKTGPDVN